MYADECPGMVAHSDRDGVNVNHAWLRLDTCDVMPELEMAYRRWRGG